MIYHDTQTWPEEPSVTPLRGWRMVAVYCTLAVSSWAVLVAVVYVGGKAVGAL